MEGIIIVERPGSDDMGSVKKQRLESVKLEPLLVPMLSLTSLQGTSLHGEYSIPVESLPVGWKKQSWFKKLTVTPQRPKIGNAAVESFPVYNESKTRLKLPKFLGLKWLGSPETEERTLGDPSTFTFTGKLTNSTERPQKRAHDVCVKQLQDVGGALLVLPCGFGKTVVSLAIASTLKRKTLVIVAAVELARQWVERVTEFLGCEVGFIQGDVFDVEKPVVVAMLQTLLRRQPDLSTFGTCIVDEAHHVAARSFSQVMPLVPCRYILGLSATPNRKDGLKKLLLWTLGPVAFEAKRSDGQGPNVMRCVVTQGTQRVITYKNGEVGRSKMITLLTLDVRRNHFIVCMINSVLKKNSKRKVLMLSDRRDQVEWLQSSIKSNSWSCGVMLGGMKPADIEQQKEAQVLLSTYHYCSEGFDLPRLDTLFLCSPRSDIEQSVGRVLRQHPEKQKPLIMDFVDNFSVFEGQSEKRMKYFQKLECNIKSYTQSELIM
jgi:superfamily II DNA or RNA helicase